MVSVTRQGGVFGNKIKAMDFSGLREPSPPPPKFGSKVEEDESADKCACYAFIICIFSNMQKHAVKLLLLLSCVKAPVKDSLVMFCVYSAVYRSKNHILTYKK